MAPLSSTLAIASANGVGPAVIRMNRVRHENHLHATLATIQNHHAIRCLLLEGHSKFKLAGQKLDHVSQEWLARYTR